jgi:cysteine synthase
VGTGGHSSGIYRVLRRRFPRPRLIGVDSVGSTIFEQPPRNRLMRGWAAASIPATSPTTPSARCTGSTRPKPYGHAGRSPPVL